MTTEPSCGEAMKADAPHRSCYGGDQHLLMETISRSETRVDDQDIAEAREVNAQIEAFISTVPAVHTIPVDVSRQARRDGKAFLLVLYAFVAPSESLNMTTMQVTWLTSPALPL